MWSRPKLGVSSVIAVEDFDHNGSFEALVTRGPSEVALVDATSGEMRWSWIAPAGASIGSFKIWRHGDAVRFVCFPQNALSGVCIDLAGQGDQPAIVWKREYPDTYWQGFGPHVVLADMDRDEVPDVVLAGKPGYAAVIDAETGAIRFDVRYEVTGSPDAGRPYGLVNATDLDGDGYTDLVVASCQVEEYVAVLRNEDGKSLRPLWSVFIERDLPDDVRELRPNVTSVVDLDGDGKKELVLGLFNVTGDERWHTVVIDPLRDFDARRADLVGRYFWGCYDLDGDGRPEIVTSEEATRVPADVSTLHAVDGVTFRDVATVLDARLETASSSPLSDDTGFMAIRATPRFHRAAEGESGLLLSKREGKAGAWLWGLRDGESQFDEVATDPLSSVLALSTGAEELQRVAILPTANDTSALSANAPLIGVSGGRPQLVFALSDGTVRGGEPDLSQPGQFKSSWSVPGQMPALWVSPAGEMTVVTATDDTTLLISRPASDGAASVTVKLPHPLYRNSTTRSAPTVLPFGDDKMLLYVCLQTGVHTMASALYDAEGTMLWIDEKDGPYPRTAAFAELAGRPTLLIDNHGKHLFYDLEGHSRLIAHGWNETVSRRSDGAKYAVPIVGPIGAGGETRVLMSSGLQSVETLDADGKRLAKQDFASTYEFEWNSSAVGRIRPDGGWDLAMVTRDGVLHCIDTATCQTRWTFDLGCKATLPINIVSADLDSDGRDNFLAGLPDGTLLALDERDGRPDVLWRLLFDNGVRDTIIGDLDSDGHAEIVIETEDGAVRVLKEIRND